MKQIKGVDVFCQYFFGNGLKTLIDTITNISLLSDMELETEIEKSDQFGDREYSDLLINEKVMRLTKVKEEII